MLANKHEHNYTTYRLFFSPFGECTLAFSNNIDCVGRITVPLNSILLCFNEIFKKRVNIKKKYCAIDLQHENAS